MSVYPHGEDCERCNIFYASADFTKAVEAFELFGEILCDSCFDNRCEAAWDRQQEDLMSEPPMTLDEQHLRNWNVKHGRTV